MTAALAAIVARVLLGLLNHLIAQQERNRRAKVTDRQADLLRRAGSRVADWERMQQPPGPD